MADRLPARSEAVCPQKLGTFVHKDNQSGDFCLLCAEKASSSLQISFIRRYFLLFIVHSSAKTRKSHPLARGMAPQVDEHGGRSGGGARVGGSSGKSTVSGEATRRYFTLGHTAARDARRVPASSSPRTVTGGARLSSPTAFFVHYLQKTGTSHTEKTPTPRTNENNSLYLQKHFNTTNNVARSVGSLFHQKTVSWKVYSLFTASLPPS